MGVRIPLPPPHLVARLWRAGLHLDDLFVDEEAAATDEATIVDDERLRMFAVIWAVRVIAAMGFTPLAVGHVTHAAILVL